MAIRYPKNKFKIHLPSLEAAEIADKRAAKKGILKEPGLMTTKVLDSSRRRELSQKIKAFKDGKKFIRGGGSHSPQ